MPKLILLLTAFLTSCTFVAPARDNAQWTTTVHEVQVTWRWVTPGALVRRQGAPYAGYAIAGPLAKKCVVDIDPTLSRGDLVRVAAHEYGHCAAGWYLKLGANDTEGLSAYHKQIWESWPERYAQAYLAACGNSLKPLGWKDIVEPKCAQAPDPQTFNP